MKKLMIATAFAAVAGGAFAMPAVDINSPFDATNRFAQVYQMAMSAKMTESVKGEISPLTNPFVQNGTKNGVYREVTTKVFNGLIWGCGCETLWAGRIPQVVLPNQDGSKTNTYYNGAMIWDTETHMPIWASADGDNNPWTFWGVDFIGWDLINAIGQNGQECEASFSISPYGSCNTNVLGFIQFAGFGRLGRMTADGNAAGSTNTVNCTYYVENMSGDFAGIVAAPIASEADIVTCFYCGDVIKEGGCETAQAWEWCYCDVYATPGASAIHGQWYIRYSEELSNGLMISPSIGHAYDFGGRDGVLFQAYETQFVDKNFKETWDK